MPTERAGCVFTATAVLFAVTGCAASTMVPGNPRTEQGPAPSAAIGVERGPVRDGDLAFVVTDVIEREEVGDTAQPGLWVRADGVYVVVTVNVRNVGPTAVTFVDRYQRMIDDTGTTFSPDMAADIYGNRDVPSTKMAPGRELTVRLGFDTPVGTRPRSLVLRQSDSSPGVTVPLS